MRKYFEGDVSRHNIQPGFSAGRCEVTLDWIDGTKHTKKMGLWVRGFRTFVWFTYVPKNVTIDKGTPVNG